MKKLGLIGRNISYSFSESHFNEKFKNENINGYSYELFDLDKIQEVGKLLSNKELIGFNITIPYKKEIIHYLDSLSAEANEIKAVNTVAKINGKWVGFNTDEYGFQKSLLDFIGKNKISNAFILGTGGASLAVAYVLDKMEIPFSSVSRSKEKADLVYTDLSELHFKRKTLLVNCTPLGTFPNTKEIPNIPLDYINGNCFVHDLIYNPGETMLMKECAKKGAKTKNGLEMLHGQADKAWEIWTNKV